MPQIFPLLLLAAVLLCGCGSQRPDLVESGYLSVDTGGSPAVNHAPEATERDGGLLIEGWLDTSKYTRGDRVDVTITGPDGAVVQRTLVAPQPPVADDQTGPRGQRRGQRTLSDGHATYSAFFLAVPPRGSVVKVRINTAPGTTGGPGQP